MPHLVGLVFIESLHLTALQWAALGLHSGGWLWHYGAAPEMARRRHFAPSATGRPGIVWLPVALLLFGGLWWAFWNAPSNVDVRLLFDQTRKMGTDLAWTAFLSRLEQRIYLDNQTPFVTYWIARVPLLWWQQLLWFPWALLCAGLVLAVYGRAGALLLATPVVALMIHQPGHDTLLFGALLIVLRLLQLGQRGLAALVYGLTWWIKPLTLLTAPFLLPRLGVCGMGSVAMWGGYVLWSQQWAFGRAQTAFLLHQLCIAPRSSRPAAHDAAATSGLLAIVDTVWHTLRWRWTHLGAAAAAACPFYLFPAYLRAWRAPGVALLAIILLGYGNIKYLLLALLFVFPEHRDES